jgi:lysozyme family protein
VSDPALWFDLSLPHILEHEGGDKLVDHPADPGGITRWGISLRALRKLGIDVDGDGDSDADDIRALSIEDARGIYSRRA